MNQQLIALAYRRNQILLKISEQRTNISGLMQQLQHPLSMADAGLKAVHMMRNHPAWVAGAVTALLAWRLKGIAVLAKYGWKQGGEEIEHRK